MNPVTSTCDLQRLEAFLHGELSDTEEGALAVHLNDCIDCQRRLEAGAAEPACWNRAGVLLQPNEPADDDAVRPPQPSLQIQHVLAVLAPTDDPEMLGRLGGYEVSGVIGSGGMGVVLKAFDRSLDRTVAIKVLAPHLASSGAARKRFAREARAAAAVLHPNVMAIHGVSNDQSLPYLVMPYVSGASLQKRIDIDGPLPVCEILRMGAQVAAGLAAAHAQGLVHRDIKPANILLENGVERVAITDFGLARAVDDATMTRTGVIAGTPQYMSPEQARGEPVDQRSDLFSLGSVLYSLCTGRPPFRAETSYGILRRISDTDPRPIREINPDIPAWLSVVIDKLMSKARDDRFATAEQVAVLLQDSLAHVQQPTTVALPESCRVLPESQPNTVYRADGRSCGNPSANFLRSIMAGAVACALIFSGVLIVLELNKGTLTIESEAEDVPIRIKQGDEVVEQLTVTNGATSLRIAAGRYIVEIEGEHDRLMFDNKNVIVARGETELARIVHKPDNTDDAREIHGLVTGVFDQTVDISVGIDDGVKRSMRFHVFRGEYARLGKIEITRVEADRSAARIIEIEDARVPIRKGDRVVAVSPAATANSAPARATQQRQSPQAVTQFDTSSLRIHAGPDPQMQAQVFFQYPQTATITLHGSDNETRLRIPARLPVSTGQTLKGTLSTIPDYSGLELTVSVELAGVAPQTRRFLEHSALPVALTSDDVEQAVAGNMVTKVIYLPNSDNAEASVAAVEILATTRLDPGVNPFTTAAKKGFILAVVRLGNRAEEGAVLSSDVPDSAAQGTPGLFAPR